MQFLFRIAIIFKQTSDENKANDQLDRIDRYCTAINGMNAQLNLGEYIVYSDSAFSGSYCENETLLIHNWTAL